VMKGADSKVFGVLGKKCQLAHYVKKCLLGD
jgi:hypothetical protein